MSNYFDLLLHYLDSPLVVEAADLKAITPGNLVCQYANDTYVIVPASYSQTGTIELEHIDSWAKLNNLTPNRSKTVEVISTDKKSKRTAAPPPPLSGITRRSTLNILGVTDNTITDCQWLNTFKA